VQGIGVGRGHAAAVPVAADRHTQQAAGEGRTVTAMADAPQVQSLLTTAPDKFVATRNALAKELRAAGRKEEAAAVAALHRPTVVDWALNSVAATSSGLLEAVVGAAHGLRQAQKAVLGESDDGDAPDLREAMTEVRTKAGELRAAAEDVLRRAGRPSSDLGALSTRVNEVMVSDALLEQLQGSRLGTAEVGAADPFAGMPEVAPARAVETAPPKRGSGRKTSRPEPSPAPARAEQEATRRREHERALALARRKVDGARRALERAQHQANDAADRLVAAQDAAEAAQSAVDAARSALEAAEQELDAVATDS
jgi:hypothetical protein